MTVAAPEATTIEGVDLDAPVPCQIEMVDKGCRIPATWVRVMKCGCSNTYCDVHRRWLIEYAAQMTRLWGPYGGCPFCGTPLDDGDITWRRL